MHAKRGQPAGWHTYHTEPDIYHCNSPTASFAAAPGMQGVLGDCCPRSANIRAVESGVDKRAGFCVYYRNHCTSSLT
jgi:hypothetical protein